MNFEIEHAKKAGGIQCTVYTPMIFLASSTSKFRQKKTEMQKKGKKCMFNFKIHAKKRAKMHFQFRNSYKKSKNKKKNGVLFGFFRFYIPCALFCILNLKIHKKNKNKNFQIAKMYMQQKKSQKYYFKKTGKKKDAKSRWGKTMKKRQKLNFLQMKTTVNFGKQLSMEKVPVQR